MGGVAGWLAGCHCLQFNTVEFDPYALSMLPRRARDEIIRKRQQLGRDTGSGGEEGGRDRETIMTMMRYEKVLSFPPSLCCYSCAQTSGGRKEKKERRRV